MKNPVRNVIVEYKNRHLRKGNSSLWGNLDLKSISREVETEISQSSAKDNAASVRSKPQLKVTKNTVANELSVIATTEEFKQKVVEPNGIIERVRFEKTAVKKVPKVSVADNEIGLELSILERENAYLKRELIARLRSENKNLSTMLWQVEQRTTYKK